MFSVAFITLQHKTCSVRCLGLECFFTLQCCNDASDTGGMELLLDWAKTQHTGWKVLEKRGDLTAGNKGSDSNPSSHIHGYISKQHLTYTHTHTTHVILFNFYVILLNPVYLKCSHHLPVCFCMTRVLSYSNKSQINKKGLVLYVSIPAMSPFTWSRLGIKTILNINPMANTKITQWPGPGIKHIVFKG